MIPNRYWLTLLRRGVLFDRGGPVCVEKKMENALQDAPVSAIYLLIESSEMYVFSNTLY